MRTELQQSTAPPLPMPQLPALEFELPPALEASEPPEARGLARDDVRLMVSHYRNDRTLTFDRLATT